MEEVKLPELGENIDSVQVSGVLVAVGDAVRKDQPLIEVETEKASLEVPSPVDGTIAELLVESGDTVSVGQVFAKVEAGKSKPQGKKASSKNSSKKKKREPSRSQPEPVVEPVVERVVEFPTPPSGRVEAAPEPAQPAQPGKLVAAAPSTRRLAREIGVDITQVAGTGPGGRVSRDDVKARAKQLIQGGGAAPAVATPALPDFSRWGEIEREPLSNIRRATVRAMSNAWNTIPHVTQFDQADVTRVESVRKQFNQRLSQGGAKLTMTAIIIKMVASALKQFPKFNASLDVAGDAVVHKHYHHVGVAVDTERGLLVPVIRDVDRKGLQQIASELGELAAKARDRKLSPDDMQGATFTVSNLGGLGTTYFTPIVNWPEVAILGVGRATWQPVWQESEFQPQLVMPLAVSYDHRIIDGADAARFLRFLAEALEQPLLILMGD